MNVAIVLFSEIIWLYYTLIVLSSTEQRELVTIPPLWWGVAAIVAYVLNVFLLRNRNTALIITCNFITLAIILFFNWKALNSTILFSLFVSIAIIIVFSRSIYFHFKHVTRKVMLQRFEGNLIFYALFALVLLPNGWGSSAFHVVFLLAILFTLIGMILSLERGQQEKQDGVEVYKVGQAGWFTTIISGLFLTVALISSLLFLPSVRSALLEVGTNSFILVKNLINYIFKFFAWIISLLPTPEGGGELEAPSPAQEIPPVDISEEIGFTIPLEWLIIIGIVLVFIIGVIFFAKFLKRWKPRQIKEKRTFTISNVSWWSIFLKKCKTFFQQLKRKWRARFIRYYKQPIFWYYQQVENWGRKNGRKRSATETANEYIERIIESFMISDENREIIPLLRQLSKDYEAAYYGNVSMNHIEQYKELIARLKRIKVNNRKNMTYRT